MKNLLLILSLCLSGFLSGVFFEQSKQTENIKQKFNNNNFLPKNFQQQADNYNNYLPANNFNYLNREDFIETFRDITGIMRGVTVSSPIVSDTEVFLGAEKAKNKTIRYVDYF